MRTTRRIKVLVVDDSMVFREVISRGISSDDNIEVVATAVDPFDARDKLIEFEPDVMTCDVEMPKMNGIDFIRRLLPQYPIPVIVVSTVSEAVFEAMNAGAVDFVTKPNIQLVKSVEGFINNLIAKIKVVAHAKVSFINDMHTGKIPTHKNLPSDKIIAIGASTGGTEAIYNLLKHFPKTVPGIVIVQHIPPVFSQMFSQRLNNTTALLVKEAQTGDYLEPGKVLVAPGDQHMVIRKMGTKYIVECYQGDLVNGHCPSVDVLFESVAKECGKNSIGIILTGMGYDGAKGLLSMRLKGANTIGQDENSSVVYGMPKVAFNIGAVEKQVPLGEIPQLIYSMLGKH